MTTPEDRGETQQPAATLPTPLSAALGLAAAYVQGVRRLPVTAVKVPVHAVGYALAVTDNLRREYEELAERGEALVARLRGRGLAGADEAGRAVSSFVDAAGDTLVETGRGAAEGVRAGAGAGLRVTASGVDAVADRVEDAAAQLAGAVTDRAPEAGAPEREATEREPTPQRPTGRLPRHDSAAETAVREQVESVTRAVGGERVPGKDELPVPDFDHLSLAQVRGRLRRLSVQELVLLRNYERAHADRLPIVTMLDNRISKLAGDASPGGTSAVTPGADDPAPGAGATGRPDSRAGDADAGDATATGRPDTSGPGSAGGDALASGGSGVKATTEAAPSVPAGADSAGDR